MPDRLLDVCREGLELVLNRLAYCEVAAMQLEAHGDEPHQLARMRTEISRLKQVYQRFSGEALPDE